MLSLIWPVSRPTASVETNCQCLGRLAVFRPIASVGAFSQKWSKLVYNGSKWPKMVPIGFKWSNKASKLVVTTLTVLNYYYSKSTQDIQQSLRT